MRGSTSILPVAVLAYQIATVSSVALYAPIPGNGVDKTNIKHIKPSKEATLLYANNRTDDDSLVNIILDMNYPTVILENIDAIKTVDCADESVTVTFNDTAAYQTSVNEWHAEMGSDLVVVTNHMGDCDVEVERGFFLVESLSWDNETLVVIASGSRTNITQTAGEAGVSFGGMPATGLNKRLSFHPSYTTNLDLNLPVNDVLFNLSNYLKVVANEVSFNTSVTYSGHLKYSFLKAKLTQLSFDFDITSILDISLTAEIQAAYSKNFTFAPNHLSADIVNVPGILTIGPALTFIASADIIADFPVNATVDTKVGLADGNVHVDFLNKANTNATGWMPTYNVTADVSGKVNAAINPSTALTVEIEIDFFSGLVELTSGLTATAGFTNNITLSANQATTIGEKGKITSSPVPSNGSCGNGLEIDSDFNFGLVGFITKSWSKTLYKTSVGVVDQCWNWA